MELYYNGDNKEASNVFWFYPSDVLTIDYSTLLTEVEALVLSYVTAIKASCSNEWIFRGGNVEVNDSAGTIGIDSYLKQPGLLSAPPLPEDVAVVVQKVTDFPGKSGRGRWYMCGVADTLADGSYLTAGGFTAMTTMANFFAADVSFQTIACNASLFSPDDGNLKPIQFSTPVSLLGTRRRRRGAF